MVRDSQPDISAQGQPHLASLALLGAVYLLWGAIASLNDILIPYLKNEFALNFGQAMRIQLVFYAAYFVLSVPAGLLLRRRGFRFCILLGLTAAIAGCLSMAIAYLLGQYGAFLAAIFILASGITMLQVSANPFVTTLGPDASAPSRLTLMQSFHSLGTVLGPLFGAILIFSMAAMVEPEPAGRPAGAVLIPYLTLAALLSATAFSFMRVARPGVRPPEPEAGESLGRLLSERPGVLLAVLALFCYVGAEIAIGSFLTNYLGTSRLGGFPPEIAGRLVSIYWGGALVGRFVGVVLLRHVEPYRLLTGYALVACALVVGSMLGADAVARWSILSVGFFNSIMFPAIFALTLKRHRDQTERVSGLLCLGIVGGAVISQLQGLLADEIGIRLSFLLPVACYLYIAGFAWLVLRERRMQANT